MRSGVKPAVLFDEPQRQASFNSEDESMEMGEEASGSAEQEKEITVKGTSAPLNTVFSTPLAPL
jgi:hypothetical protein